MDSKNADYNLVRAYINVPDYFKDDISILLRRLNEFYSVYVSSCGKKIQLYGPRVDVLKAQDYALRFIGPEAVHAAFVEPNVLELFVVPSITRFFQFNLRVLITTSGNNCVVLRGSRSDTDLIGQVLQSLAPQPTPSFFDRFTSIDSKLKKACNQYSINYKDVCSLSWNAKSALRRLLTDIKDIIPELGSSGGGNCTASINNNEDVSYVEAYRKAANAFEAHECVEVDTHQPQPLLTHVESAPYLSKQRGLRPVIIDGANVAFATGTFEPESIQLAFQYFQSRGHEDIQILIPRWRQRQGGTVFAKLEADRHLFYTPSRIINNERQTAEDDTMILELAVQNKGVVISNDQYRNWFNLKPEFRDVIENRLLQYTLTKGVFMLPFFPFGGDKPSVDSYLSFD